MRRPLAVIGLVLVVLVLAALAQLVLDAAASDGLAVPGCSTEVATAKPLPVTPKFLRVPGAPFGVVAASDGHVFVSLPNVLRGGSIAVLSRTKSGAVRLRRVLTVSRPSTPYGLALAPNGRRLYVADGFGLSSLSVRGLERGTSTTPTETEDQGSGPIYVELSKDGRYAFVSDEYSADISVFDLTRRSLLGDIPVPPGPVGLARSIDGRYVFATSETDGQGPGQGRLSVIDEAKAVRNPARGIVRSVDSGCSPVRVAVSRDGKSVWITARGSNAVVAFNTAGLISGSATSPIAVVPVGASPVGLHFLDHGRLLAVANSNRFAASSSPQTLSIIDTAAALGGGSDAVLGTVATGIFPREMTTDRNGSMLYVTNYGSASVESIPVGSLHR